MRIVKVLHPARIKSQVTYGYFFPSYKGNRIQQESNSKNQEPGKSQPSGARGKRFNYLSFESASLILRMASRRLSSEVA